MMAHIPTLPVTAMASETASLSHEARLSRIEGVFMTRTVAGRAGEGKRDFLRREKGAFHCEKGGKVLGLLGMSY